MNSTSERRRGPAALLFVHSPLVGPSSWRRVADVAATRGYDVAVPDLTGVADAEDPRWRYFVDRAVRHGQTRGPPVVVVVVVGHSGAGVMLPAIADRLADRSPSMMFVDAIVPSATGAHRPSSAFVEMLDRQTRNGTLERWLDWWPDETVTGLLPDRTDRELVFADMPRLRPVDEWRLTTDGKRYRICDRKSWVRSSCGFSKKCSGVPTSTI